MLAMPCTSAEDYRRNEHLDELDESITKRLHCLADIRIEMAQQDADHDRCEHLHIEMRVKRFVRNLGRSQTCRLHGIPPYSKTPAGAATSDYSYFPERSIRARARELPSYLVLPASLASMSDRA
jgi:hypothetical protein